MGVPALFRWLSKKYPKIVESVKEEEQEYAPRRERRALAGGAASADDEGANDDEEVPIPIDMSGPNPNGEEFDALYLDMNGIVHPCTHPEGKPAPETEEDMMLEVFLYTERVVNMVRPRKLLMMAIDGVAPRAKMNQQRSRRFRAAQETRQKDEEMEKALAEWKSRGIEVRGEEGEKKKSWDRNAITPGTPFMDLLASSLRYWVAKKMNEDAGWKNLQVIISDASVPGEGEHKIMDHIRRQRAHPSHDPNTKHVIYGLDADLIMLSLATHEPYFKVLREDVFAQQPGGGSRACNKCGREGHFAANCIGQAAPKPSTKDLIDKSKKEERKPFIFLDVCILREYLEVELAVPGLPFAFDLERAIDDWIFLIFFVGNDFLPHLPSLEIREGAIDELLKIWKRELPKMGGYVTAHGRVELANIQNILSGIAVLEDEIFRKRRDAEERQDANQKRRRIEDHARQEAEFAREKGDAFKHGETEYVQVPGQRAALPARPDAAAEAALAENRAKAIAALESGDTTQVIDNARAIRLANLSAAERLKAELAGAKTQAALKAAGAFNKAKAKAMRNGTAVEEEAKIVELSEEAAASSDNESFATAADAEAPAEAAATTAADESAVFKMDEDAPADGGAESASARARKRTIDEVEGEVTPEGDEKVVDGEEDGIVKVVGDEEEVDPVVATNFERVVNADGTVTYEDTVKLWEPGYRERYYQQKFGVGLDDTDFRRQVVKSYVEGLAWVLMYYYQGCPSWTWYYPYHFSPFAADFVELETLDITFNLGKPFRPYDQLMGVLPADSRASIPPVFHSLMLDEDSEIIDFYPTDFAIDMNGKKMEWQGVALLPFIDEKRLLDAIETRYPQLSEDELRRNAFGDHTLFVAETHPLYEPLCKLYAKRKNDKPVELDPSLSGGITGTVKPDPTCVPGSTFNSPLTEVGQPDIHNDQSISTLYEFPEQTTPHRSVLLKGVRPPKRVLTSEDKEWTRMGAPDRGRGRGRGRGGPSRGSLGRKEFGDVRMGAGPVQNMSYNGYGGGGGSFGGAGSGYNSPYGGSYASSYGGSGYNTPSNGYGGQANAAWSAAPAAQQAYGAPPAGAYGGYSQPAAQAYGGYGGAGGAYSGTGAAYGGTSAAYGGTGAAYGAPQAYGASSAAYGASPGFAGSAYGGGGGYQPPAQQGSYGGSGAYTGASAYGGAPPPGAYGGYGGYGAAAPQSYPPQQQQHQQPQRPSGPPPPLGFRGGAPRGGSAGSKRGGRGGSGGPWGQY